MAYNTGNPIGSGDPRDLRDNSENLDEAINGTASTWVDRLGVTRKTFKAAENAADAAESAANNAINTLIPAQVDKAEAAADGVEQIKQNAQASLDAAEADWEERFLDSQQSRDIDFAQEQSARESEFQQQLIENGYQELGEYTDGIVIDNLNQTVTVGAYLYRLSPTVPRPYTTSGDWQADVRDFVQIDFVTASQLQAESDQRASSDSSLQQQITEAAPIAAAERPIVQWHGQVIENSLTIPTDVNAFSFGPEITIAAGQEVTVSAGSSWTIANGSVQQ